MFKLTDLMSNSLAKKILNHKREQKIKIKAKVPLNQNVKMFLKYKITAT